MEPEVAVSKLNEWSQKLNKYIERTTGIKGGAEWCAEQKSIGDYPVITKWVDVKGNKAVCPDTATILAEVLSVELSDRQRIEILEKKVAEIVALLPK